MRNITSQSFADAISTNLCRFDSKPAILKKYFLLALFILMGNLCFSQNAAEELVARFDTINHTLDIEKQAFVYIDSLGISTLDKIEEQQFVPLQSVPFRKNIPRRLVLKPSYLRFTLQNTGNFDRQFYFYPGMHYSQLTLYKNMPPGKPEEIKQLHHKTGFVYIQLPARSTVSYVLRMSFARADYNRISAKLIEPPYLETFKLQLSNTRYDSKSAGFILSGVLLMMILFTLVNYIINGREEFFYNCLYSVCMFLIVFLFSYLKNNPGWFNAFFLSYFSLFLLITGTLFYVQFTRKFLDTANRHPLLDKIFKAEIWLLSLLMLVFTSVHYLTDLFVFEYYLENAMKLIALAIGLFYIVIGLSNKDRLMNYLALGNAIQVLFSFISLLCILLDIKSTNVFNSALFYFELGVVASVFFFLLGLTYKNRAELIGKIRTKEAMKLDEEKLEFETRLAIVHAQQAERNRISADMHDDLGAGMTTIRLYSELAKNKMGNQIMPEIEKISSSADELLI